ncbi:YbaB/EbfC family nucleoid-associated protein [Schumannella sp. 10F1B-5-1]|uniref:YbaB/EbfC family nucleoid-associated protein n=1 Tax=Schumannella sp. 10F1B-5-1 TaxID=2590780 RepID=UPI0015E84AFA|nr:YbaB/EbfC family nucleoid-associated protein [Schumannella sp. 10F1B-5-1]
MSDARLWSGDPDEIVAQVERQVLAAQARSDAATRLVTEIESIEAAGSSSGGEVTVRVDSSGRLQGVAITAESLRSGPEQLEKLVLEASAAAQKRAARAAVRLTESSIGGGLVDQLRGQYESRLGDLGEPDEDDGSTPRAAPEAGLR